MRIHFSREIKIGMGLYVVAAILFVCSGQDLMPVLEENAELVSKILAFTTFAVLISVLIHFLLPLSFVRKYLSSNKPLYLFFAGILGIITPGPIYAIYPIVLMLKRKGISNPILVSYITGQTIIGPARIPFEMGLFGLDFMLYRLVASLLMAPLAGLLYIALSKKLPDREHPLEAD